MNPLDDISDSSKSAFGRPVIMISLISYYLAKLQAQISKKRKKEGTIRSRTREAHTNETLFAEATFGKPRLRMASL